MTTLTYVQGAERMITAATLTSNGVYVRFADQREGTVPFSDLRLPDLPRRVVVPRPHVIELHMADGGVEEVPWDFARHYADERYQASSDGARAKGRRALAQRLRALRVERGITQQALADRAGLNRVSVARLETGGQLPRYRTLVSLAGALDVPVDRLLVG